jgi:hypothetical protein
MEEKGKYLGHGAAADFDHIGDSNEMILGVYFYHEKPKEGKREN